ncbi:hypothetical protein M413DRAFT_27906 [Hebeloma cylindrosporum]|uniref:Uncharacterized protein n=1 Tax=Hebeloma cylindrosporum TaxID=76867 RepID=A0A0C2YKR2_HEBCY|nr:hypothetical protein M413DRAFT_27906 [Hebeloma cylindrosporum h7]
MSHNSAAVDHSDEWVPAEEILETGGSQKATVVGLESSSPLNEAGPSDQSAPTNIANGSALESDTEAPPIAAIPTPPSPTPPPLPSSSDPQTYVSPAKGYSYISPPATAPYQSPAYPPVASCPPHSQRPSTIPAETPYLSYGPQRGKIRSAPQPSGSSQPMYGKSPAYGGSAPQQGSARPQSYGGPTIPGVRLMPYSNFPRPIGPISSGRKKVDAFVANDPFRPNPSNKHNKLSDDLTFDDIPVAGATGASQPWRKYDPGSESTFSSTPAPYPRVSAGQQQSQPPPSVPWRPSQSSPYDPPQSSTNPPLIYPGSSQYPQPSQPIYSRPSGATSPIPYDGSPDYRPWPQVPPSQSMPYPSGGEPMGTSSPSTSEAHVPSADPDETTPRPTCPAPASSSNTSLDQQPTLEPVVNAPGDSERPPTPVGRPPTPGDRPSDGYPPPRTGYPVYSPYDSSEEPFKYPVLAPKESIWSRISYVLRWPFSRRRYDNDLKPDPSVLSEESKSGYPSLVVRFVVKTMPREVYLHFLLRLPSLYFSRVARIFEEADLTLPEIKKMALETASRGKEAQFDIQAFASNVPPQYEGLKSTWEAFIDSVMREWKTFNVISVLLLSAILTILQIESAADDPLTRYLAIFSLICSLISLLFGCMYIIRFGTMRKTYKAAEWALEAKKTKTVIWWNVWVLLAMPVVWLTWSIMLYIACIMSFIWRTSAQDANPPADLSESGLLAVRIVITVVLGIGMLYGWLILSTFSRYGEVMDRAWKSRIDGWLDDKAAAQQQYLPPQPTDRYTPYPYREPSSQTQPQYSGDQRYPYAYSEYVPDYGAPTHTQPYGAYPPDFNNDRPTYINEGYVPPPEPYASDSSPSEIPHSSSSSLDATRANTKYNKASGLQREDSLYSGMYHDPGYATQHPLPPPPPDVQYARPPRRVVPQKTHQESPSAAPSRTSLPLISGTPMPTFVNRSSAIPSFRDGEADDLIRLTMAIRDGAEDATHVRFRSPLFSAHSAQGSFNFAGSEREVEESFLSAGSGSSFTPRPSPLPGPSEHGDLGRETDSLRRRRLG